MLANFLLTTFLFIWSPPLFSFEAVALLRWWLWSHSLHSRTASSISPKKALNMPPNPFLSPANSQAYPLANDLARIQKSTTPAVGNIFCQRLPTAPSSASSLRRIVPFSNDSPGLARPRKLWIVSNTNFIPLSSLRAFFLNYISGDNLQLPDLLDLALASLALIHRPPIRSCSPLHACLGIPPPNHTPTFLEGTGIDRLASVQ